MIRRCLLFAALALGLVLGSGCSKTYHVQIESDTCWNGLVNDDQGISDCGNSNYRVVGALRCVKLTKQTANGYLRVRIDGGAWSQTSDPYATVQVCK